MWSLGALFYFMVMGYPAFIGKEANDILVKAMTLQYDHFSDQYQNLDANFRKIIESCL